MRHITLIPAPKSMCYRVVGKLQGVDRQRRAGEARGRTGENETGEALARNNLLAEAGLQRGLRLRQNLRIR